MQIAVTGSIATDHLMTFPGRFRDSLFVEQLDKISLSFLVEELQIRRGGVAANICFGMANLGLRPLLVGSVGADFAEYRSWLDRHGVDTGHVRVSELRHTARFVCTTDTDQAQIASFYAGAMSEAREIELAPLAARVGGLDLVLIGADDPEGMLRHTQECRSRGYAFAADPSQQLAFSQGPAIRTLVEGASYLFTNEYEAELTEQKTGWTAAQILDRVGTRVTTLGAHGSRIERAGQPTIEVGVADVLAIADPTGAGDAFRAGFLAALSWQLPLQRCAEVGSMLAAYVIETVGTQEYEFEAGGFLTRLEQAYGPQCATEVAPHLGVVR